MAIFAKPNHLNHKIPWNEYQIIRFMNYWIRDTNSRGVWQQWIFQPYVSHISYLTFALIQNLKSSAPQLIHTPKKGPRKIHDDKQLPLVPSCVHHWPVGHWVWCDPWSKLNFPILCLDCITNGTFPCCYLLLSHVGLNFSWSKPFVWSYHMHFYENALPKVHFSGSDRPSWIDH